MAKRLVIDDGSFKRFLRQAPKEARKQLAAQVDATINNVAQRMRAKAPVGPDAPHIKDDIEVKHRANALTALAGYFGSKDSGGGGGTTQPAVALFNEFKPNKQAFMRPATDDEANGFKAGVAKALMQMARNLAE